MSITSGAGLWTERPVAYGPEMSARWVDYAFRSRETGKITLAQAPNVPLGLYIGVRVADAVFTPAGTAGTVLHWIGVAALVWWGGAELLTGVNPFRRLLGVAALTVAVL